ncbi:MAG: bacterial transcriptional activator domain-containing protein [Odoribacteraceae bacterium]|jgi:DNA-binding SARP family transcriptional activator|nr:bacterial transcriptional activator domain-containing protein [Odoribacteraceae bacterium]
MHPRKIIRETILLACLSRAVAAAVPGDAPVAGLSLNNGHFFHFNDEIRLSFDLALERGHARYLAYLVRLNDLNKHAVDLILDLQDDLPGILVISGERLSKIPLPANPFGPAPLPLSFYFDLARDRLSFTIGDTVLEVNRLGLHPGADYRISIGSTRPPAPLLLSNVRAEPDIVFSRKLSGGEGGTLYWVAAIVLVDMLVFLVYARGKRRRRRAPAAPLYAPLRDEPREEARPGAVYLFGDFRVIDRAGDDASRRFTPLLKELFLILLLYSRRDPGGISPAALKEMLWLDKGLQSAANNRAVNVGKLKAVLDAVGGYEIVSNASTQRLELGGDVFCDYLAVLDLSREKSLDRQRALELARLAGRGPLLPGCDYEWLDAFKADLSGTLVDALVGCAGALDPREEARVITRLADTVFLFDPLNEEALRLKCKALVATGKHSLAAAAYARFAREYESLYGVAYAKNFPEVSRPG